MKEEYALGISELEHNSIKPGRGHSELVEKATSSGTFMTPSGMRPSLLWLLQRYDHEA